MYDLTEFQRDIMFALAGLETGESENDDDKPHGLAIKQSLETYYGKDVHHGRLYPNLDSLVDKGLIEKGAQDKRTNFYHLTTRGWRELETRKEWEDSQLDGHEEVSLTA